MARRGCSLSPINDNENNYEATPHRHKLIQWLSDSPASSRDWRTWDRRGCSTPRPRCGGRSYALTPRTSWAFDHSNVDHAMISRARANICLVCWSFGLLTVFVGFRCSAKNLLCGQAWMLASPLIGVNEVALLVGERLLGPVLVVVVLGHLQNAAQLDCRTIENSLSSSLIF